MGYRPDINGLRAIAVICVVLYHFNVPGFRGGFVGVDVFFVISGFLMTHAVMSKLTGGSFSVLDFYTARARRIVPALVGLCLVLLAAGAAFLLPSHYAILARQELSAVTFVSNVVFWQERGYFDAPSQDKFLLHTWSLSVEWQFYLLFPVLVVLLYKYRANKGVLSGLGVTAAISFALNVVTTRFKPEASFFLFPPRAWELLAGSLVYLARDRVRFAPLAPVGFVAVMGSALFYDDSFSFPGAWALLPVGGAAAIVAANGSSRWLTNRPMQFIGDTSYSLYLVHWPLVVWTRHYWIALTLPVILGLIAASVLLSYLSYRFVETPFRRPGPRTTPGRALFRQLVPAIGVALGATVIWRLGGLPWRVPSLVAKNDAATADSGAPELCPSEKGVCHIGPARPKRILFWGDSHMEHLYGALRALEPQASASGRELLMAVTHGCLPVRGFETRDRTHCEKLVLPVWQLAQEDDVEAVVLGSIWTPYVRKDPYDPLSKPTVCAIEPGRCRRFDTSDEALASITARLVEDVRALVARGKRVYLVLPVPAYTLPVARIVAERLWHHQPIRISLSREKHERAQRQTSDALREVARKTGAVIIDPTTVYCPGESCLYEKDGVSIYRDTNHLTSVGARLLTPALSVVLDTR